MRNSLFGKQESQELIQESRNQAKIAKDSRIMSIKIQSCGPLGMDFIFTYRPRSMCSPCVEEIVTMIPVATTTVS